MSANFPTPLIAAEQLARLLEEPRCIVIDCRFDLRDTEAGRANYGRAHIPGARYAHLDQDLSRPPACHEGRHPLPDAESFAARLRAWGIDNDSYVVAYDGRDGAVAARLWWMLRWTGHEQVAVLNGGLAAWQALGLPLESAVPVPAAGGFEIQSLHGEWVATTGEIEPLLAAGSLLLDARSADRFAGRHEPLDDVAGHIPGALNMPYTSNLTDDGQMLGGAALKAAFDTLGADVAGDGVVAMCGSGVTACHLLLALHAAGYGAGRLYAGSWSEWIRDSSRSVAAE